MRKRIFLKHFLAACAVPMAGQLQAAVEPEAAGPVILTLRGKVRGGGPIDFDARALDALGRAAIRTKTQWLTGAADWSGVPLEKVLASAGASGSTLRMRALNDYSVTIPITDIGRFKPILAGRLNGKLLSVRDRGPLIVIYPYDSFPELNSQVFRDRAVWQLREILVE